MPVPPQRTGDNTQAITDWLELAPLSLAAAAATTKSLLPWTALLLQIKKKRPKKVTRKTAISVN